MPANPVADMANGRVVPVIIFAIFVGAAINVQGARDPESVRPFRDAIHSFNQVMFGVAKLAIRTTPYGAFGLITAMAARYGLGSLLPLGKVIVALYVACLLHMAVVYGGLLSLFARVNPVRFFRKAIPTIAVAFSTQSSYATLPVNLQVITKRMKVSTACGRLRRPAGSHHELRRLRRHLARSRRRLRGEGVRHPPRLHRVPHSDRNRHDRFGRRRGGAWSGFHRDDGGLDGPWAAARGDGAPPRHRRRRRHGQDGGERGPARRSPLSWWRCGKASSTGRPSTTKRTTRSNSIPSQRRAIRPSPCPLRTARCLC